MALLDAIKKNLIKVPLVSTDKDGIIEELATLYASEEGLSEDKRKEIISTIEEREMLGSTAMENGIAIPHARFSDIKKNAVMIGVSRLPVAFGGKEGTRIFFLVLASDDNPSEHIQLLSSIAKVASSQLFVRMLLSSKNADDVYRLFFE